MKSTRKYLISQSDPEKVTDIKENEEELFTVKEGINEQAYVDIPDPEEVTDIEESEEILFTMEEENTMHEKSEKPCKFLKEGTADYFENKLLVFLIDFEHGLMERGKRILEEVDPMKGKEDEKKMNFENSVNDLVQTAREWWSEFSLENCLDYEEEGLRIEEEKDQEVSPLGRAHQDHNLNQSSDEKGMEELLDEKKQACAKTSSIRTARNIIKHGNTTQHDIKKLKKSNFFEEFLYLM
jgi:hypothetical protein